MTQSNTKASRANQPASATDSLSLKPSENQRKQTISGGLSKEQQGRNPYLDDGLQSLPLKNRTRTYHEQILDSWSERVDDTLTDEQRRNWPRSLFETSGGKHKTSFFHALLTDDISKIPREAKSLLESLVIEKPDLLALKNEADLVPINKAAKTLPDLVFLIFDLVIPEPTRKNLEAHSPNPADCKDCPLWSISPAMINFRSLRSSAASKSDTNISEPMAAAATRNTTAPEAQNDAQASPTPRPCLHDKLNVNVQNLLGREKKLRSALKEILDDHGQAQEILQCLLNENGFDTEQENARAIKLQSFRNLLELCPDKAFKTAVKSDGGNLLQLAVSLFGKPAIDYKLHYDVVEALVRRCPASIFFESETNDGRSQNVYSLLAKLRKPPCQQQVDVVRNLIKFECIRYTEDGSEVVKSDELQAKKRNLLYGHGETEKRLYLNLKGETAIIDNFYADIIISQAGIQLETVLEFVSLPNWKPDGAELYRSKRVKQQAESNAPNAFPDPYIKIFNWMWDDCSVRKIMTLEVDDSGPEPHSNAAIREALQGVNEDRDFGIEVWKWQKVDIDIGTVAAAAPRAREVHLVSSGNMAVLRGWSCSSGLATLSHLEKLIINIRPKNPKDGSDCHHYEPTFKRKLAGSCARLKESDIKITFPDQDTADGSETSPAGAATAGPGPSQSSPRPKRGAWIEELTDYKQFITSLGRKSESEGSSHGRSVPKVKVAILDDGARLADLNGVQVGESFRADGQDYFVGQSNHGTEMAVCVRDICSMAELYIARLDDSRVEDTNQFFTISSCTKALKWALDRGADVISMSWSYEMQHQNMDQEKMEFETLVQEAVGKHKAVLFGSLPDLGPDFDASKRSPVSLPGVIKISSATRAGRVVDDNYKEFSEFLLPGQEIESSRLEKVQGSSFATAYAAGLAGLVLYSFRVLEAFSDDGDDLARKAIRVGKSPTGMKGIFDCLASETLKVASGSNSNFGRFVRPARVLSAPGASKDKQSHLRDIVNNLVPDTLIRTVFPGGVPQD